MSDVGPQAAPVEAGDVAIEKRRFKPRKVMIAVGAVALAILVIASGIRDERNRDREIENARIESIRDAHQRVLGELSAAQLTAIHPGETVTSAPGTPTLYRATAQVFSDNYTPGYGPTFLADQGYYGMVLDAGTCRTAKISVGETGEGPTVNVMHSSILNDSVTFEYATRTLQSCNPGFEDNVVVFQAPGAVVIGRETLAVERAA